MAITGGSGFVGSAIYRACLSRGFKVYLLDKNEPPYELPSDVVWEKCDVTDKGLVISCLNSIKPDHIYLIAGVLGTTELTYSPMKAVNTNIGGLVTFIEAFIKLNFFPRVFYVTKPNVWENMYTITKESSERILKLYMSEFNIEGCIHRWFNAYGPGQHTHPIRKAVPNFILNALHDVDIEIWGNGLQTVDLIHIDDIAYLAVEAMNKPIATREKVIDIGSGVAVTVNELAQTILRLTNSSSKIIHKPMRPGEIEDTVLVANVKDLNHEISNGYIFRNLEEGLIETIEYYKSLPEDHIASYFEYYKSDEHDKYYYHSGRSE
ncbi:hypothetical protein DC487_07325 [Sphingobacterium corticibacter]|uniref:NAD-dependent epimerase/dehydratase domain-containing protein n=1 Tax=Sphingobacterium corticibacter TaxID=2171749 RepID=A0A2T8HK35_9SPHI|nr:hypothetical protein DC487_07325 [Sphingobacterium corticibacter]